MFLMLHCALGVALAEGPAPTSPDATKAEAPARAAPPAASTPTPAARMLLLHANPDSRVALAHGAAALGRKAEALDAASFADLVVGKPAVFRGPGRAEACVSAIGTTAAIQLGVDRAERAIDYLEFEKALGNLQVAAQAVGCLAEPLDRDLGARAHFLLGYALGQQGDAAMLNAMAAQFAGESFAPLQEQLLKKASASRDPIKMAGGLITPDGGFVKDPEASQDKQVNMLLQRSAQLSQIAETADTARERIAAQRAQQELMGQMRMMGIDLQRQGLE
jgi:hypothetical protein